MNKKLENIPKKYKQIYLDLLNENNFLKNELLLLKEQLKLFLHRKYSSNADDIHPGARLLFNEAEEADSVEKLEEFDEPQDVKPHTRKKPKRKPIPENIPRIEKRYELDEKELTCSTDGDKLVKIGEDISEQLDIIPAKIRVIKHIRFKYACKTCEEQIKIASMDPQPIPKSLASPGLLAHVAVSKYEDSLPLYRQEQIFKRIGIDLPRSSLASWMIKASQLLSPIINKMKQELLTANYLQCDETPVQVLNEPGKPAKSKSYMWVVSKAELGKHIVLYHYSPSRSGSVPVKLLRGFKGYLQTDGYEGYNQIRSQQDVYGVACLAHIRRKFVDAVNAKKKPSRAGICVTGLDYITKLYNIEKQAREMTWKERYCFRLEKAKPIIDDLHTWLFDKVNYVPPQSLTGKAMTYFVKQWPRFVNYLADGKIEVDNNRCERMVRPFTIGRKNWLFSATVSGATASADLYSLIVTAKQNGLNTYDYLKRVLTEIPKIKADDIDHLMPYKKLD
jgi:transposase